MATPSSTLRRSRRSLKSYQVLEWLLNLMAILAWGALLIKYWLTGEINVLLHPDYVWLAYSAGFFLLGLGGLKVLTPLAQGLGRVLRRKRRSRRPQPPSEPLQHMSLLPSGWGSALLLGVALFGLQFSPQPFSSQTALDRGVTDTLTMTRSQPQAFRTSGRPENRNIIDWVRTLNVYPEPDAYTGQKANVEGFVIHQKDLPNNYLMIARFVITCCAADAYPVALPVKLEGDRTTYKADAWFRVEGQMITETVGGRRQLVIQAQKLTEIPKPRNPYDY
jgi:uncharacterized repeat protein (TIGR03943 family)